MGFGSDHKIRPAWTHTLGDMIDDYHGVQVTCDRCRYSRKLKVDDIAALAEKVGRDYSLWNRRCKCRLTPGCQGWNSFHYMHGVYRRMRDGMRIYAELFDGSG